MTSTFFFVRCPTGDAEFPVDPAKVPQGGIHARCTVCSTVFLVQVPTGTGGGSVAGGDVAGESERERSESRDLGSGAVRPAASGGKAPDSEEGDGAAGGGSDLSGLEDVGTVLVDGQEAGDVVEGAADGWSAGPLPEESDEPDEDPVSEADGGPDPGEEDSAPSRDSGSDADDAPGTDTPERVGIEVQAFGWPELDRTRETSGDEPPSAKVRPAGDEETGFRLEVDIPAPAPDSGATAFGRRDPHDKARRLSRVLVSDMITYHRERHVRALAAGTLPEDFDEEIRRSWDEYVLQVGREIAEETPYFRDALNEILAGGRELF